MLRDFKASVTKQSLVDLAVALVIALAAFALIRSLINNVVLPLVAIPGAVEFGGLGQQHHGPSSHDASGALHYTGHAHGAAGATGPDQQ